MLDRSECEALAALFDGDGFRSTVEMARHRFGEGRYRYFSHPLPEAIQSAREAFYERLAPTANRWADLLVGREPELPRDARRGARALPGGGAGRPTPLLLRYRAGDWNALHQDLYGDVYFPFQVLTVLSEAGADYTGGEFVLLEQRPRAQSRAHVVAPAARAFRDLPDPASVRTGARAPTTASRCATASAPSQAASGPALGIIFHDSEMRTEPMNFMIYESPIGPLILIAGQAGLRGHCISRAAGRAKHSRPTTPQSDPVLLFARRPTSSTPTSPASCGSSSSSSTSSARSSSGASGTH